MAVVDAWLGSLNERFGICWGGENRLLGAQGVEVSHWRWSIGLLSTTLQDSSIFLVPKFLTLSDYLIILPHICHACHAWLYPDCFSSCFICFSISRLASWRFMPMDLQDFGQHLKTSELELCELGEPKCPKYCLNFKQFYRRGQPNKLNSWASWPDPCWSCLCLQRISDLQDLKLFLVDVFQGLYVKSRRGSFCDLFEIHAEMKRMQQCNTVVWSCGGNGGQNGLFLSPKSTNTVQSKFWNLVWEIQNQNNQASAVLAGSNYISLCWRWQHVWTLETVDFANKHSMACMAQKGSTGPNSTSLLNDHLRPPYQIRLGECIISEPRWLFTGHADGRHPQPTLCSTHKHQLQDPSKLLNLVKRQDVQHLQSYICIYIYDDDSNYSINTHTYIYISTDILSYDLIMMYTCFLVHALCIHHGFYDEACNSPDLRWVRIWDLTRITAQKLDVKTGLLLFKDCSMSNQWCDLRMAQELQTTRDVASFQKATCWPLWASGDAFASNGSDIVICLESGSACAFELLIHSEVTDAMIRLQHFEISGKVVQVPGKLFLKNREDSGSKKLRRRDKYLLCTQNYAVCSGHRFSLGWLDSCLVPRKQMETAAECAVRMIYRIPMLSPQPRHTMDGIRIGNFSHRGPHWRTECLG